MFESIVVLPRSTHRIDFGQVIENLFFYKETRVHIGRLDIPSLVRLADTPVLEELFKLSYLSVFYNNSHPAIKTHGDVRSIDSIGIADLDIEKELYTGCFETTKDDSKSKKFSRKISRLIYPYQLPDDFGKTMTEQLKNNEYLGMVLDASLKNYNPEYFEERDEIKYELEFLNESNFRIHSNINPDDKKFGIDIPILGIINACADMNIMAETSSEISIPSYNADLIRLKTETILQKSLHAKKEIEVFNHFVFDDSWELREAINSKRLHVKAILETLRKAQKYKDWLHDLPKDTNLMGEYVKKIQERSILDRLPLRPLRFCFFNGLAFILGTARPEIGVPLVVGANAFDAFLLNKLTDNWSPSQFIEGDFRRLLDK